MATISPKVYAAYAFAGDASDIVITFGSATCTVPATGAEPGHVYGSLRGPTGVGVPSYISGATCGGRYFVERSKTYDTGQLPAAHVPAVGQPLRRRPHAGHEGGDIWATDAALDVMDNEDWSGIFVTLPGVDKAAHMWGGVNDPESAVAGYDPMTHLAYAADVADAQVGRIMDKLEADGELDNTLVVLTADHGSVAAAERHRDRPALPRHCLHGGRLRVQQLVLRRRRERRLPHAAGRAAAPRRHGQRRLLLQRLRDPDLADRPVAREDERGGRHHGADARRHRGVAQRRRPLHAGLAGPLRPDDHQGRAPVVRQARPGAGRHPGGCRTGPT